LLEEKSDQRKLFFLLAKKASREKYWNGKRDLASKKIYICQKINFL